MTKQVNKVWWIEEHKPVVYKQQVHHTIGIEMIKEDLYRVRLVSPTAINSQQFAIETDLTDIEPYTHQVSRRQESKTFKQSYL